MSKAISNNFHTHLLNQITGQMLRSDHTDNACLMTYTIPDFSNSLIVIEIKTYKGQKVMMKGMTQNTLHTYFVIEHACCLRMQSEGRTDAEKDTHFSSQRCR